MDSLLVLTVKSKQSFHCPCFFLAIKLSKCRTKLRNLSGNNLGKRKQNEKRINCLPMTTGGIRAPVGATQVLLKSLSAPQLTSIATGTNHKLIKIQIIFHNTVVTAQN